MVNDFRLDVLDREIIEKLTFDSRLSIRQLAVALKVAPATVAARVKKLEENKVILGYGAIIDDVKVGRDFIALTEITIRKGALLEVQKKIAHMPGVESVYDVTGNSDSMALCKCKNRTEYSMLVKKILAIDNVERANTHVILNVIKENGLVKV